MGFWKNLKYRYRLAKAFKKKSYDDVLLYYQRIVKNDLTPEKKKINFDQKILAVAENIFRANNLPLEFNSIKAEKPNILILSSEIYDSGGHTEVAIRYINAFKDDFTIIFYLTTLGTASCKTAPEKSKIIKSMAADYLELPAKLSNSDKVITLYYYIVTNKITTLNVNIHMFDSVGCAVLGLIKKYTDINIVYWNHTDHLYALGTEFADVIMTRCVNGKAMALYLADKKNVVQLPFLEKTNVARVFASSKIQHLKQKWGVPQDAFITMTGASMEKLKDKKNTYFELVKKILEHNANVCHVLVSSISLQEKDWIRSVMGNVYDRFITVDFTADFDLFIQASDLYIDSFPQGSALTLVDFIKHKKPVVIKVNKNNPIKSFEKYLYDDYEYACENISMMFEKTNFLIRNKHEYDKASYKVHKYYYDYYSIEIVKQRYEEYIK